MLLEQYGRFKKAELEESPFRCLLNANIEINPHQINAFCAAIQALKTGGIVLADEVGLGKTIEAGLTLKYVLDSGAKHVLIALPATLRKQWEVELEEKFNLQASILDRLTVESNLSFWKACLENRDEVRIVITSYDYSSKLMQRFSNVKWDFIIIDEAHNLRNVFHGTKRAKRLYELSKGIPKILLTATPLQNSLSDLHGLISFIDPRIFGSEKVFNKRFIEGQDYTELKRELIPVLYRTLRRDVGKYMDFKKRECRTIDFVLSPDEVELYMRVNNFLKKDVLYSIPNANKGLIVMRKRLILLRELLSEEGTIWIQIDDEEQAYLKVLCDEVFGRGNFVNMISVNMKNIAGVSGGGEDKRLKKNCEYILIYAKDYSLLPLFNGPYVYTEISDLVQQYAEEGKSWKYTSVLVEPGEKEYCGSTVDGDGNEIKVYLRKNPVMMSIKQVAARDGITEKEAYQKYGISIFQTTNAQSSIRTRVMEYRNENSIAEDLISIEYVPRTGKNRGTVYEQFYKGDKCRLFVWLKDTSEVIDGELFKKDLQGTYWDMNAWMKNLTKEGSVEFGNGKKPEQLIRQIFEMTTKPGDWVLDSFLGSGTTAAVATKMAMRI